MLFCLASALQDVLKKELRKWNQVKTRCLLLSPSEQKALRLLMLAPKGSRVVEQVEIAHQEDVPLCTAIPNETLAQDFLRPDYPNPVMLSCTRHVSKMSA